MNLLKVYTLLPCSLITAACSVNSSSMHPALSSSTPQVQKSSIEISCQDLQNPAYQKLFLVQSIKYASNHANVVRSIFPQPRR